MLPAALRRRAAATELATEVLDDAGPTIDTGDVGVVAEAIADDGRIRFRYAIPASAARQVWSTPTGMP